MNKVHSLNYHHPTTDTTPTTSRPPAADLMDEFDDTNYNDYPPNPPYNHGDNDEWPRLEELE